jgi:hypothetical protein
MVQQLVLLSDRGTPSWKIDDQTKQVGRNGVACARAILSSVNQDDSVRAARNDSHAA